jgi:hypothetical protein
MKLVPIGPKKFSLSIGTTIFAQEHLVVDWRVVAWVLGLEVGKLPGKMPFFPAIFDFSSRLQLSIVNIIGRVKISDL